MDQFVNDNGRFVHTGTPIFQADNRSFRYGDGLFETIKVHDNRIVLQKFHFERMFSGLETLLFKLPKHWTDEFFRQQVLDLCTKNNISTGRVRISFYRGEGGLYDLEKAKAQFIIEAWPLPGTEFRMNENGLIIDIFVNAKKSCDQYSNIKSNNYLPYVMAALYAKEKQFNDCIVLNQFERICDATIANVFWVKENIIYTPPLTEGPVSGVIRRYLLEQLPSYGFSVREEPVDTGSLKIADEIFLTNAIHGLRWVKEFNGSVFKNDISSEIYSRIIQTIQS